MVIDILYYGIDKRAQDWRIKTDTTAAHAQCKTKDVVSMRVPGWTNMAERASLSSAMLEIEQRNSLSSDFIIVW